jgi:hypothetical protein
MTATVVIKRITGTAGSTTNTTIGEGLNSRMNAEDAYSTADTTNPIKIGGDGGSNVAYSFWAVTQLKVEGAHAFTKIDNIQWYTTGTYGANEVSGIVFTGSGYVQATQGSIAGTGTELTRQEILNTHAGADMFNPREASDQLLFDGTPTLAVSGIINSGTLFPNSNLVYQQIVVSPEAVAGPTSKVTVTWQYDEV